MKPKPRAASRSKTPRRRLSRQDWIEGAFEALAERGLPAIAVDTLAERLGVTKGSFYWHFRDADDLLSALVARWEELSVDGVLSDLVGITSPCAVLRALITRVVNLDDPARRQRIRAEATLAGIAEWQPIVRGAYVRITQRRWTATQALYAAAGLPAEEAAKASRYALMTLLGVYPILLAREPLTPVERAELAADLCERLLPPRCRGAGMDPAGAST
jgi:AcrR family transcriptional regulator